MKNKIHCLTCGDFKELPDGSRCPDCYLPIHHLNDIIRDCIYCFRDCRYSGKTGGTVCERYIYKHKSLINVMKTLLIILTLLFSITISSCCTVSVPDEAKDGGVVRE